MSLRCLLSFLLVIVGADTEADLDLIRRGARIPAQQFVHVRESFLQDGLDRAERLQLLGFYWANQWDCRNLEPYGEVSAWFVREDPEWELNAPYGMVPPASPDKDERGGYLIVRSAWEAVSKDREATARALKNAARFFEKFEPDVSLRILRDGAYRFVGDPEWSFQAAEVVRRQAVMSGGLDKVSGEECLTYYRQGLAVASPIDRILHLSDAAFAAFWAGDWEVSELYADELLAHVDDMPTALRGFYADQIYGSLSVKGLLSVVRGDHAEACEYLNRSAETRGSPSMKSFGPNLVLADRLLSLGYKDAVLGFLKDCTAFYKGPELQEWIVEVEECGEVEFPRNLLY